MTQTGTSVSLGQPLITAPAPVSRSGKTGFLSQERQQSTGNKSGKAAKRFTELLRKAAGEQEAGKAQKNLMGEKRKPSDATDPAQAGLAVAAVSPDAKPSVKVEEPGSGDAALVNGPASVSDDAAGHQPEAASGSAVTTAPVPAPQIEEERLTTRLPGTGPGGRPGEPPGSGGQIPGPEKGSITQVQVTDGAEKPGSQNQGPGTGLPEIALQDLNLGSQGESAGGDAFGDAATADDAAPEGSDPEQAAAAPAPTEAVASAEAPPSAEAPAPAAPTGSLAVTGPAPAGDAKTIELQGAADAAPLRGAIVDQIEAYSKGGAPSVKLILQPEHLGEIQVKLTLVDGSISAMVKVDNPQVREAVAQQLEVMRTTLADQGIKIDKLEVSVSGGSDQHAPDSDDWSNASQWQGRGDAQDRREAGDWALPQTYRSLLRGGGDMGEGGLEAEPRNPDADVRTSALDVKA